MTAAERAASMLALRRTGRTYADIGERFGVTKERVRQILGSIGADGRVCLVCGGESAPFGLCAEHSLERAERSAARDARRHAERGRERRAERRQAGLCPRCGSRPEPGYVLCKRCRSYSARYLAAGYARRKAAHRCVLCGDDLGGEGTVYCLVCLARLAEYRTPKAGGRS